MQEVLMVYRDVSIYREGAVHDARPNRIDTVCVEEKPGVHAIGLTAPDLPPATGKDFAVGRDDESSIGRAGLAARCGPRAGREAGAGAGLAGAAARG
jgi:hypothetical protein